jgi:isopentenyl diphosphate isomerase/L-lactate dehydrogenase-like FMN-dependent dehydrogenase
MADQPVNLSPGIKRQAEIYQQGLTGITPSQPLLVMELEQEAKTKLKAEAFNYLAGGAGVEDTMRGNRLAFQKWNIVPRFLRNVARRDLQITVLGRNLPAPIILAPIGVLGILHKDGELAVARAARSLGLPFVVSTVSSHSMEEIAEVMGDSPRWFQLYWPGNSDLAASFLQRAERAGFSAVVVTLDTYLLSWRPRDLQNSYLPFLKGDGLANYFSDPVFRAAVKGAPEKHPEEAIRYFMGNYSNPTLTWEDLSFLRRHTRLPILLKGILSSDDARQAADHGMEGIIISNHGGRQLDGAIPALEALPPAIDTVADRLTVLFDSGIRCGADIFKALALGAKAVLVGRPYCYGLAVNGEQGVYDVMQNLFAELDLTLGLAGCASVQELSRENLAPFR